jgi:tRNA (guanine37-N1)-methyltransferase
MVTMRFDIFTLFPAMFDGPLTESILKRAQEAGLLEITLHNIRDWAVDRHHTTDDTPFGGGGGMIFKPEPLVAAIEAVIPADQNIPVILLSPQGRVFDQRMAYELAAHPRIGLVCGRYEGIDERAIQIAITDEISIGDYVLTGGELGAMVLVDAITRLLPGVLGEPDAHRDDSHATGLLEGPTYTRPPEFRGLRVPDVLISGHAAHIARWHREESLRRTWQRRPDLLARVDLSKADREFLERLEAGEE